MPININYNNINNVICNTEIYNNYVRIQIIRWFMNKIDGNFIYNNVNFIQIIENCMMHCNIHPNPTYIIMLNSTKQ